MKHILLLLRATPIVPLLVAFLVVLSTPRSIQAGGFQLNEHGARAMAMGFAVASADGCDVSTIFYNPAGLPFLRDGFSLMVGTQGLYHKQPLPVRRT